MPVSVIVVDDDGPTRRLVARVLRDSFSATVREASDNAEALRLLQESAVDLITSDINRPGGTGLDLLLDVRASSGFSNTLFVVISGNFTDELELALYRSGADAVFRKPFELQELLGRLSRLLRTRIDPVERLIVLGFESSSLDYKEDFDISERAARASIAKDVIAMANSGGGSIVIGVAEPRPGMFEPRGLPPRRADQLEATKVNDALRRFIGAAFSVSVSQRSLHGKTFVVITVPSVTGGLLLAGCDNPEASLYMGRIYARTDAARSEEVRDNETLSRILREVTRAAHR